MKRAFKKRIVFRADGNSSIGLGHVYRLLSLADICKGSFECLFIIREPDTALSSLILSYCSLLPILKDNEPEVMSAELLSSDILVLDGYNFDTEYQKKIRSLIYKLAVIDDTAENHFFADIIINHGGEQIKHLYRAEPYSKLLIGFPYLLLRKEFLEEAKKFHSISKVNTVFICMGGSDPFNITVKAAAACIMCDFIKKVIIVTGSGYRGIDQLEQVLKTSNKNVLFEQNVSSERIIELLSQSEIAIAPSSSISLEICCVKAGLLTGTVIENQDATNKQLIDAGCCISLGDFNTISEQDILSYLQTLNNPILVRSIIQNQADVIDGYSGKRILEEFKKLGA